MDRVADAAENRVSAGSDMRTSLLVLLCGVLYCSTALAGEADVGSVTHLSGAFSVKRADGTVKLLSVKSDVQEGDVLITAADTYARIKFVDGGEVVLRPETQFKVEKYAFNESDASKDSVILGLLKGGLRAVTGLIGKRSRDQVGYTTSVATIGIRGTNHGMLLCNNDCGGIHTPSGNPPPNGLHVDVAQGEIVVTNQGGSQQYSAGQFGFVGGLHTPPVHVPPGQGIQVTMPQSIANNNAGGRSPDGANGDTSCAF